MAELVLMRSNKVTVKVSDDGVGYVADFYRTHKHLMTINSVNTGWVPNKDATPTGNREAFRLYVIKNADAFGIDWKPEDMRADDNKRIAHYNTDTALEEDAINLVIGDVREMVSKCRYKIELFSVDIDSINPKTKTSTGKDLVLLGIKDGKYEKSGNWAWADIKSTIAMKYEEEEIYSEIMMELVSGQLKKPKLLITEFNTAVQNAIKEAGITPIEDAPKEEVAPVVETQEVVEEPVDAPVEESMEVSEVIAEDTQDEDATEVVENKSGRRRTLKK